ncbi:MAG: YfcL family protein, partial [Glaciecola sp.]
MQSHLDSFIVDGSDQELFIASYLHGHFDVAVAETEKKLESQELV